MSSFKIDDILGTKLKQTHEYNISPYQSFSISLPPPPPLPPQYTMLDYQLFAASYAQQQQLLSSEVMYTSPSEKKEKKESINQKEISINSETSNKLKLVSKYAKKIDELNESSLKKAMLDKPKSKKIGKKAAKAATSSNNEYRCNCDDLACCRHYFLFKLECRI